MAPSPHFSREKIQLLTLHRESVLYRFRQNLMRSGGQCCGEAEYGRSGSLCFTPLPRGAGGTGPSLLGPQLGLWRMKSMASEERVTGLSTALEKWIVLRSLTDSPWLGTNTETQSHSVSPSLQMPLQLCLCRGSWKFPCSGTEAEER